MKIRNKFLSMRKNWKEFMIVVVVVGFFINPNIVHDVQASVDKTLTQVRLITEIFMLITKNYVEPVESQKLVYGAAKGMITTLDPFSQFLPPEEYKQIQVQTEGSFGGLGIRISVKDDWLTVITPLPETPAYKLGILPGDRIIAIEGVTAKGITVDEAIKKLRGKPGTKVKITIERDGEEKPLEFEVTREIIKLESVFYKKIEEEDFGYIHIREFSSKTAGDLESALKDIEKQNVKGIILDLRNNPGGLLSSAVDVCKKFIGDNKLIVYTQGRDKQQRVEFKAADEAEHAYLPMVVLVNQGSASGAEIVAGAIKDWKRGVIVGMKTFGKGSVQTVMKLTSDNSGLRLTTSKYYTPSGVCIHEVGIEPDIEVTITNKQMAKIMMSEEKIYYPKKKVKDEDKKKLDSKNIDEEKIEDLQLNQAISLLRGRIVFLEAEKQFKERNELNKEK
ncbi:S41 family peptidase [bacterium]